MSAALAIPYMTEEDYLAQPETMLRQELLDGEIVVPPAPSLDHQDLLLELALLLRVWSRAHPPAWVGLAPIDVVLGPDRVVQPDLLVLKGGRPRLGPVRQIPDLVVEVLSANRSYDRVTKRLLYAEAGVGEYWMVDPHRRAVEVVVGLETVRVERERLRSRQLDGLEIDLGALFRVLG